MLLNYGGTVQIETGMKPRVLYVEDEPDLAESVCRYLNTKGFDCKAMLDGGKAMQALEQDPPDLVVLDVMLPGLDGWEICRQIKAAPGLCDIPVLFVSARGQAADRVAGLELGAQDYLTKPFSLAELAARLRVHLELGNGRAVQEPAWNFEDGALRFNPEAGELRAEGSVLILTRVEAQILKALMLFPGKKFDPEKLARLLWDMESYLTTVELSKVLEALAVKVDGLSQGQGRLVKDGQGWRWSQGPKKA
jgi:two-component system catabolic regulation response regulator CreB